MLKRVLIILFTLLTISTVNAGSSISLRTLLFHPADYDNKIVMVEAFFDLTEDVNILDSRVIMINYKGLKLAVKITNKTRWDEEISDEDNSIVVIGTFHEADQFIDADTIYSNGRLI